MTHSNKSLISKENFTLTLTIDYFFYTRYNFLTIYNLPVFKGKINNITENYSLIDNFPKLFQQGQLSLFYRLEMCKLTGPAVTIHKRNLFEIL